MILNTRYTVKENGLKMISSIPLNWKVRKENADGTGNEYFHIYIGGMAEGHSCIFQHKILTISNISYSSSDQPLKFKVDTLENAGIIVDCFSKGMKICLKGTIYIK